jgi:predicted dehydrogenase
MIGTGVAATELYLPALQELRNRIDLVACTNRTRSKAEAFAAIAGVGTVHDSPEALIADPGVEAVMISLPIDVMPGYTLAALRAGKAVLAEKPIAATVAAGRKLVTAASKYNAPHMIGENFAFMSHAHQLAKWIATGRLGEIRFVEAHQLTWIDSANRYFQTSWRQVPAHIGGFVADGGVHVANLLRRCMGDPVVVKSITAQFNPALPPVDTAVAVMQFESGALGTWTSCFTARGEAPMLRVYGSKANAEWYWSHVEMTTATGVTTRAEPKEYAFTAQFRHFADVVVRNLAPAMTPEEALGDLVLIDRILRGR